MADPEKAKKTKSLLMAAGCLGLSVSCCLCLVVAWFQGTEMREAIAAAGDACDGQAVPAAAAYTPGGAQRFAFFTPHREGGWDWEQYLGDAVPYAEETADVTAVLCVSEVEEVTLETCQYEGGQTVTRTQYRRRVRLAAAQTGALIEDTYVNGTTPAECPGTFSEGGGGVGIRIMRIPVGSVGGAEETPDELEGTSPTLDDVGTWALAQTGAP